MGTVKVSQQGDTYTVEDADDEVHTGLSLSEVAALTGHSEDEIESAVETGEAGVGYLEVDDEPDFPEDEDEEDESEEDDEEEDK